MRIGRYSLRKLASNGSVLSLLSRRGAYGRALMACLVL